MFKLIAGFTVLTGLIGFLAETIYREFFESIVKLALSEDYSYIIVSFFTVLTVLYLATRYTGFSYGVRLSKLFFATILVVISLSTYTLAHVDLEHRVQLMGLSFACIFITLLVLIYELNNLSEVIVLLTPLLLIPLPAGIVDPITLVLSRTIGILAGVVTGARVIEAPGFTQLEVVSASGEPVRLSIEAACTGIITASSIIAIAPLIAYIAAFSEDKPLRKIIISLVSITIALLIGLTGNFIRVILVIYATMKLGVDYAYSLYHYSPSILYSAVSVIIAFYITRKYLNFKEFKFRNTLEYLSPRVTWNYIAGVFLLVVLTVGAIGLLAQSTNTGLSVPSVIINTQSVSDYLDNPVNYLSTSKVVFTSSIYDAFLTRVLGALAVYRVSLNYNGELYTGFIEVVDTPARLHTWELCLTLQGYYVKSSWSIDLEGVRVNYIVIERDALSGILAHTLIPVTIRTPSGDYNVYTRASLLSWGRGNVTDELSRTLVSIIIEHSSSEAVGNGRDVLSVLVKTTNYILSVFLIYLVVLIVYKIKVKR